MPSRRPEFKALPDTQLPYDILRFEYKNRLPDRFLTTSLQTFPGRGKAEPVGLAVIVEIINPWHPTALLGQQLVSTLNRTFDQFESNSTLVKFEEALKAANQVISQINEQLETAVNCLAVLLTGPEIHFSLVGQATLLISHQTKALDAIEKQEAATLFSSVTSGDIAEGDLIILGNKALQDSLGDDNWASLSQGPRAIFQTLSGLPLLDSESKRVGLFLQHNNHNPISEHHYWENLEPRIPVKLPDFARAGQLLTSAGALSQKAASQLTTLIKRLPKRPAPTAPAIEESAPKTDSTELIFDESTNKLWPKRNWGLISAVIALVVIAGLAYYYVARPLKNLKNTATAQQSFVEVLSGQDPAKLPDYWLENVSASTINNLSGDEKTQVQQFLTTKNISIGTPTLINQLAAPVVSMSQVDTTLVVVDQTGQLWQLPASSTPIKVNQQSPITAPTSLAAVSPQRLVAGDQAGNLWLFDNSAAQPQAIGLPSSINTATKLVEAYSGNLYLLSPSTKTIYRISKFDREIGTPAPYIKSETVAVEEIVDLAINNQIVVINKTGLVKDFVRGKAGPLNFQLVGLTGTPKITTTEKNTDLFLSSGKMIWRYSPEGALKTTWLLPIDKAVSDIYLDQAGDKLWLAASDQLYQLAL